MSPTAKFFDGEVYFFLSNNCGKYSLIHPCQNTSAKYWTWRHFLRESPSSFLNTPEGKFGPNPSKSKWLGVRTSESDGSSDDFVMGRPLTIDSTSHMRVVNPSFISATRIFLTVLIHRSHTPLKWDPDGGLNSHMTFLCKRNSWIWLSFQSEIASRSSLYLPAKCEPLSDLITSGIPHLAMKRCMEFTNQ